MLKVKTDGLSKKEIREFELLADIAGGRSSLYQFFAGFYGEAPTKKTVRKLTNQAFVDEMTRLFGKRATNDLRRFAESYKPGHYEDVEKEFSDLFIVPYGEKFTTPYESVYKTGLMMQQPQIDVREMYKQAGASFVQAPVSNYEDYFGSELAFMSYLTDQESRAWQARDKKQAGNLLTYEVNFLEKHLTAWIGDFCDRVAENGGDLYEGMAKMTARFVDLDYEQAAELLERFTASEGNGAG